MTDYTNASRTMLFDIHSLCWNEKLLEVLDIPMAMMPEVKPSSCLYGYTDPQITGGAIALREQQAISRLHCLANAVLKREWLRIHMAQDAFY